MLQRFVYFISFFLLFVFGWNELKASHVMGGEITWECQANGQYIFTLKVYRDCNGINLPTNNQIIEIHNFPNIGQKTDLPVNFSNSQDISPSCLGNPCSGGGGVGAIEEFVFRSNPLTLNGVPPAVGWTFTWTNYARNNAVDNINNAGNYGLTLRATMFPYQAQNANPCFDSSPNFFQEPSTVVCADQAFTYNHSAYDNELDSLVYTWGRPLDGPNCTNPPCRIPGIYQPNTNPNFVPYDGGQGFSFNSPFPGPTLDPRNIPATMDPNTGEISFESYTAGEFVSVVRVQAYKCGELVAEVYRDLQTVVQSGCGLNKAPIVPPVFANGTFSDTVKAGEFVTFDFNVFDTLRTGNSTNDSIFIYATGQQFGANFTDSTTGCTNPPCATFSQALPDSSFATYNSTFSWQTSCEHIAQNDPNCTSSQNTYLFVIRSYDDFCPAAGLTVSTISITVLADSLVKHPDIHCADVQSNGDVIIDWNQTSDPDSSFQQWMIYSATNRNGPYTLIDSIADYNITTYNHNNAGANGQSIRYIVRAKSGCHTDWLTLPTDTISSMYIDPTFNGNCVDVSWNTLDNPLPDGSAANYEVYREYPVGSGFSLYQTTADTFFCDTFDVCSDTVTYRIQIANSGNGCTGSSSNIKGVRFQYAAPNVDAGTTIEICDGQSAQIGGTPTSDPWVSYQWSPTTDMDDDAIANPTVSPSDTIMYYLTVTDSLGCISEDSVLVNVQPSPQANAGVDTFSCSQNIPFQLFGIVSVSNTGRWVGGNGTFTPDRNTLNATYLPTAAEISSGAVILDLISTNIGICDPDTDQIVIQIPSFESNLNLNVTPVSCNGLSDGAAGISASGTNAPYTFSWDTGSGIVQGDTISGLAAGTYSITASNNFGCDSTLSVTITEPTVLTVNAAVDFNVSCKGLNNGIAYATPSGGTTPYSFLWSDNQAQDTARNLAAGNYSVTLSDNNGCTATAAVNITEPDSLISSIGSTVDVSCNGGSDGYAVVEGTGGTAPYTYLWSDNQVQDTARNLSAGNYRVTLTDAQNCSDTVSVIINEPTRLTATIIDSTNISCKGGNDGTATVRASGGVSPYTYNWSNSQTGTQATNLLPTTYFVTVSDANNCEAIVTVSLEEPDSLTASTLTINNVSCNGGDDGSAVVTASGGRTPYTYRWDNNQIGDTVSNLAAGSHSVTITDSSGCTTSASVMINEPAALNVNTAVDINVSCKGLNDGIAYATPSGGTAPYTYLWNDNQSQDTARNLSAGNYSVTLSDNNGCTATAAVSVTEPDSLISSIGSTVDVSCNGGNDGYAVAEGNGGTAPYSYLWSDNQMQDTARNLSAGNYRVTITDAQNCTDTVSVTINEPSALQTSISASSNVSCNGLSDGAATVSASGGTSPYTYLWSDSQTTATATNLPAGNYDVTVTDANGCNSTENIILTEPNTLSTALATQINVSCNGLSDGSAKVSVSGGTQPYTYLWSDNQTADSAISLSAGNYNVTITDNNGCSDSATVTITEPARLTTNAQGINNLSCFQANDGAAFATASGGSLPYTFSWSNNIQNDSISSLAAGTYVVTVTDAQSCTATDSIQITQPDSLQSNIADTAFVSCNGGNDGYAEVTAQGGTTPYTYNWSDNQTTQRASNLSQGNYSVTVTDNNGCTTISFVSITEPAQLTSSITASTDVSCNGLTNGQAVVTANGGTTPYTYLWSDNQVSDTASNLAAGSYSVTVTDVKGCTTTANTSISEPAQLTVTTASASDVSCNGGSDGIANINVSGGTAPYSYLWSNNQTTATANNLVAGSYTVTVTDSLGCSDTTSIRINEPAALSSSINSSNNISCNGAADGRARVSANGGVRPYTYTWSNNRTTPSIQNLSPGNYRVTITDRNSCTKTDSITITQPNALVTNLTNTNNVNCFGSSDGEASVSVSGGTSPYTYFWSNNSNSNRIQNVSAGTYRLTVTDNNNCRITDSVVINQPNILTSSISGQAISCFGRNDGRATISANGGTAPYIYNWSNNNSKSTIGNLSEGTYSVTITDINGCVDTNSYQITEPNQLTLDVTADDTVCINIPKQIVAAAQGGTGGYTYSWSNNLGNNPNQSVRPQQTTTYSVSVTDANNCPEVVEALTLTVRDIASTHLTVSAPNNICLGDSAIISVSFDGNLGPYFYNWNQALSGINEQSVSPPATTNYRLNITDICNNRISDSALIEVNEPPVINLSDTLIEGCEDLTVSFTNRTPGNYTYEWNFGNGKTSSQSNPTNVYTEPGLFNVGLRVLSPEGCESVSNANVEVRVKSAPNAEIFASPTITDIENPNIDFYGNFGDATNWEWYFGDGSDSSNINNIRHTYADTGTYRVRLYETNAIGCSDSAFLNIRINPNFDIKIPNVFIPNTGGSNGGRYNPNQPDNSVFFPYMEYVEDYHMMIFNRWGELIFESKDINIGWDGYYKNTLAQADVYIYKIEVTFINGQRVKKVGDLTLLR